MTKCVSKPAQRAADALLKAADKIGRSAYAAGRYQVKRDRRGRVKQGYSITPEHEAVIEAAEDVCRGRIEPEHAMSILHIPEVMAARFGKRRK